MKRQRLSLSTFLIPVLFLAQALFVTLYVTHEHTIYFWDHAMYFGFAQNFFDTMNLNATTGWETFKSSLKDNYNLVFALPSLVSFSFFGVSRLTFILTNFVIFFALYEIAMAVFLTQNLNIPAKQSCLFSLLIALSIPPLWLPLLEGYPDIGAAAFITFAAALNHPSRTTKKAIVRGLCIGCCLALAILLRRHFIYPAIALIGSFISLSLIDFKRSKTKRAFVFKEALVCYLMVALSLVLVLFVLEPDFILEALTTNYNSLYLSYHKPPLTFIRFLVGGFGWGLFFVATSGFYFLFLNGKQRPALLVLLFSSFWLLLWTLGPDQTGHHYMLHAMPLFVTTGICGWLLDLDKRKEGALWVRALPLVVFLFGNSLWALWISPVGVYPNDNGTPTLLSAPRPPVVRQDLEQWQKLADYLLQTTTPQDRIMIIGSSFVFNADIFHSLYMKGDDAAQKMIYRFPKSPEIDHEEGAPLDLFASASVYVVASPTQYHLDPKGQRVVTAAANQFPPPAARKSLFQHDEQSFHLDDGVEVDIWRKGELTPLVLNELFKSIRKDAHADPVFKQSWVAVTLPLQAQILSDDAHLTRFSALFIPSYPRLKLLYDRPLDAGDQRLELSVMSNCQDLRFRLRILTQAGKEISRKDFIPLTVPGTVFSSFTVPTGTEETYFAELSLNTTTATFCRAEVQNLHIESP